jgi:hypothetical protein
MNTHPSPYRGRQTTQPANLEVYNFPYYPNGRGFVPTGSTDTVANLRRDLLLSALRTQSSSETDAWPTQLDFEDTLLRHLLDSQDIHELMS